MGNERLIIATDFAWDDSGHIAECQELYPGVKVESAPITTIQLLPQRLPLRLFLDTLMAIRD